jgi:hypothetical protein
MRISGTPGDPDYHDGHGLTIVLDRAFWDGGPIISADEASGVIEFYEMDSDGRYVFDKERGSWKIGRVVGEVSIHVQPPLLRWC